MRSSLRLIFHELSFDDRFALLVEREVSERESKKLDRLIRAAGFPEKASLEDTDYRLPTTDQPEVSRNQ
ncbi:MAG: IstB-like ATP-binding domain-containing protein [Curvibacter sp.]|nr:IstB-like ATP-binding domain-containing protein [Curvibacter sp.]